jgi:hypothetical protein
MAINTGDRRPTTGPETDSFDRYSHVATDEGHIIYDTEAETAWVQADRTLALEEWR